jgi:predicted secreted protein
MTKYLPYVFIIPVMVCALSLFGVPTNSFSEETEEKEKIVPVKSLSPEELEKRWGIRPLSIRQTADGHMLDFRYRIIDAEKASPLFSPTIKPIIIDEDTGAVMAVPNVPKVGSMRSTRKPIKDRNYAILFANPHKHIKPGHKVTIVIGDYRAEHLVVEGGEPGSPVMKSKEGSEREEEFTDPGKPVEVRKGQEFKIVLDANHTTGYRWDLAKPLGQELVVLRRNEYKMQPGGRIGSGGKEIWTFLAKGIGTANINFNYLRPWEREAEPARKTSFEIIVR